MVDLRKCLRATALVLFGPLSVCSAIAASSASACGRSDKPAPLVTRTWALGDLAISFEVPSDYNVNQLEKEGRPPGLDVLVAHSSKDDGRSQMLMAIRPPAPATLEQAKQRAAPWMPGDASEEVFDGQSPFSKRKFLKADDDGDAFVVVVDGPTQIYVERWRRTAPALRCWVRVNKAVDGKPRRESELQAQIRWGEERCASVRITGGAGGQ